MINDSDRPLDALASLGDPVRRRLFRYVLDGQAPVSRDDVAAGTGVSRSTAAYHLEKLADAGLLAVQYERRTPRRGPGSGRPTKLYLRPAAAVTVSVPQREYELMAGLLAAAVETDTTGTARRALHDAARAAGARLARTARGSSPAAGSVARTLAAAGYEPRAGASAVYLRNCPFERLAAVHRELVCGASLALVEGVVAEVGEARQRAVLDPGPDRCCVVVRAA
ncbi:MAG TPA: helix-turn-helix domain-containing protein [Pilimelia sp.]|nr:helix-turn-helix domain-containing protein [Pilimelia sp.]